MGMINRDKRDESPAAKKARDVAAKLDETTEPLGGTSNMESHARVGYTERLVEARAQNVADEEGVTLHRNPDGSHTAVDESRLAEATATSGAASTTSGAATNPNAATNPGDTTATNPGATDDTEAGGTPGPDSTQAAGKSATDGLSQADVVKILRGSDSVMLATASTDKIIAHPMVPQEVTDDADVWFFLALDGDQSKALRTNPEVNISVAEAGNWLSVAGRIEFVDDQTKIDDLWSDSAKVWFDDRRDPNLGLIKVTTGSAQHWGLPGGKASGLLRMVKSKITGDRPDGGTRTTEL